VAAEAIAAIAAAGLSAIAAVLVAKLRLENTSQHGSSLELLQQIDARCVRIEERVQGQGERLAHLEAKVDG